MSGGPPGFLLVPLVLQTKPECRQGRFREVGFGMYERLRAALQDDVWASPRIEPSPPLRRIKTQV